MSALLDSLQASFSALPAALVDAQGRARAPRRHAGNQAAADSEPTRRALEIHRAARLFCAQPLWRRHGCNPRPTWPRCRRPGAAPGLRQRPGGLGPVAAGRLASGTQRGPAVDGAGLGRCAGRDALAQPFHESDEAFARLNTALATEGALIRLAANVHIEAPLHVVFVGTPADGDLAIHGRHDRRSSVRVEPDSGRAPHRQRRAPHLCNQLDPCSSAQARSCPRAPAGRTGRHRAGPHRCDAGGQRNLSPRRSRTGRRPLAP